MATGYLKSEDRSGLKKPKCSHCSHAHSNHINVTKSPHDLAVAPHIVSHGMEAPEFLLSAVCTLVNHLTN